MPNARSARPRFSAMTLAIVCGACGASSGSATTRDSAGVAIIESPAPRWADGKEWRIDSVPSIEIGVEEGDERYQLSRVYGALRLADGSILVGNSGSGEIRVFDAKGQFVRAIGRRGNGPGEFAEFSSVLMYRAPGGTLAAWDGGNLRVLYFDSSGTYQRMVRVEPTADGLRAFFQGLFSDGSWLTLAASPELRNEPGTYRRSFQQFVRFGNDGRPVVVLRYVEGRIRFVNQVGSVTNFPFVPFTAEPLARPAGNNVVIVAGGAPEVEWRDLNGMLVRKSRLAIDRPKSETVYDRYKMTDLAATSVERRPLYEHFYSMNHPIPDRVPAFQDLVIDDELNVWLERYRLPWETDSRWDVVGSDGRWLGTVAAPTRFRIMQIGRDFVLGRQLDSLGVERVRVHRLQR